MLFCTLCNIYYTKRRARKSPMLLVPRKPMCFHKVLFRVQYGRTGLSAHTYYINPVVKFCLTTQDGSCGTLSPPSGHTSPPCPRHAFLQESPGTCAPTSVWSSRQPCSTCPRLFGSCPWYTPCPQAPSVPLLSHQVTSPSSCRGSPLPASHISSMPPSVLPFLPLLPK